MWYMIQSDEIYHVLHSVVLVDLPLVHFFSPLDQGHEYLCS